jgi:HEAT repeat protein
LSSSRTAFRFQAVHTLGTLGKDAASAVPDLMQALKDPVADVRLAAIRALGAVGPDARDAVAALTGFTKDGQADVREAAEESLKKIQGMP